MTSTSTATPTDPLVKRLHTVQHLINGGKLPEAAQRLNAARKSSPHDPRVYLMGMRLAEAAGNPQAAQQAARKAVEVAPEWPVAVTELAFLLARQNQFKDAMEYSDKAVALDGDNPEVLARVIDIAHRARAFERAIAWLERAARVTPGNTHIELLLARDWR
ncbi:MAG TPA: tetratricopeptide repeat protein, partial [Ramlibacter sp.]|nr:tetratricopeptide repeat protein [Ramlibacter sp.]